MNTRNMMEKVAFVFSRTQLSFALYFTSVDLSSDD